LCNTPVACAANIGDKQVVNVDAKEDRIIDSLKMQFRWVEIVVSLPFLDETIQKQFEIGEPLQGLRPNACSQVVRTDLQMAGEAK
jgi:hypothetical protein